MSCAHHHEAMFKRSGFRPIAGSGFLHRQPFSYRARICALHKTICVLVGTRNEDKRFYYFHAVYWRTLSSGCLPDLSYNIGLLRSPSLNHYLASTYSATDNSIYILPHKIMRSTLRFTIYCETDVL